jgi:hypothetical protein
MKHTNTFPLSTFTSLLTPKPRRTGRGVIHFIIKIHKIANNFLSIPQYPSNNYWTLYRVVYDFLSNQTISVQQNWNCRISVWYCNTITITLVFDTQLEFEEAHEHNNSLNCSSSFRNGKFTSLKYFPEIRTIPLPRYWNISQWLY